MKQDLLNSYEEKGLTCPFIVSRSGQIAITKNGESIKNEIAQVATVIFETINAVGDITIDSVEMLGNTKGLIMKLDKDQLAGSLFGRAEGLVLNDLRNLLEELREQPTPVAAVTAPQEKKEKLKLESGVLEEIKKILKDYLGDFAERVYKNQLKTQRIKVDEFHEEEARRLIFTLGKAAGMIIGPSKGEVMTKKMLEILK